MMDLIIKNGTIITATDTYQGDIAVKDGKIALIGQDLSDVEAKKLSMLPANMYCQVL